jgi:hypothetical protein
MKFITVELAVYFLALGEIQFTMTAFLADTITEVSISRMLF